MQASGECDGGQHDRLPPVAHGHSASCRPRAVDAARRGEQDRSGAFSEEPDDVARAAGRMMRVQLNTLSYRARASVAVQMGHHLPVLATVITQSSCSSYMSYILAP